MKKFNLKSKKLLTTALFITSGLTILSHSNPVKADACPSSDKVTKCPESAFGLFSGSCY